MSERQVQFRHYIVRRSSMDRGRARRHRRNAIDDGFHRVIFDLDRGQRVFRLLPALGDDDRDRLADIDDFVDCENRTVHLLPEGLAR